MTAALEGGEWSAARTGHTLPTGKTRYPFYRRLGWPQGRSGRAGNLVPNGIRSRTVRSLVSRYIDWAIGHKQNVKWSRYRPGVPQRVGRVIALLFHDRGTRRWVSGQQHAPATLYPQERAGTHFTEGCVGPRAGLDCRKISSPPGFDPGTCSQ